MIYDPQGDFIWLFFRPWIWIPRLIQIFSSIILFSIQLIVNSRNQDEKIQKSLAKNLLKTIIELGPCFIKLGQALSTRPDLVNKIWLDELTKLQDDLPAFNHIEAKKIFEKEIGKPTEEIFDFFPLKSVASASLGQVYKAKLNSNYWVAVKIQRPNLEFIIRRDLVLIRLLSIFASPFLPLNLGFGLDEIVDEFGLSLYKEIDYEQEAENAERFAEIFKNNKLIKVPIVEKIISSKKVITTSWIEGTKIQDREALLSKGINPTSIIRTAVISGIQQLLEFGYFHADPHPGNLFALQGEKNSEGKIGYVDFGMMDSINDNDRIILTGAIVHLVNQDFISLANDFKKLGFLSEREDINKLAPVLEEILGGVINKEVNSFNIKTITDKFSELMFDYPFRVPARFALIIRAVVSQEGLALKLDPEFKIIRFAYPYVAKRLLTEQNEEMVSILMDIIFDKENQIRVDRIEALLDVIEVNSSSGSTELIPVAKNGIKLLVSSKGVKIRKKFLMSLIKNDEFNATDVKQLGNVLLKKFMPEQIVNNLMARMNSIIK
ncbi:ABC1 kinase family protein [Prochlorococcus marinus]|uniref:ABC1 kinase family protein n=1 Tax=Prochlorococcus marinus TaxID=1219 RepID=UPI0022B3CE17|nr:AarF/ABC1/UbiB kinase family protein [Prochlorococcus marinus]